MDTNNSSGPAAGAEPKQPGQDRYFEERMDSYRAVQEQGTLRQHIPNPLYMDMSSLQASPRKSKFLAGLLSFFVPGTGHFYLGLMQKGLYIMMLLIFDIAAMFHMANSYGHDNSYIPFQVLLGCLIPVIYFYNIFDALQSTDQVNTYRKAIELGQIPPAPAGSDPLGRQPRSGTFGMALIAIGFFLFLVSAKPAWMEDLFGLMGSYVGAVILIGAGILLFLAESKKR